MGKVSELIKQIPYLCQCDDPDRWSDQMCTTYDRERKGETSVYDRQPYDEFDESGRLNVLFRGLNGNDVKIEYCRALLTLNMYCGYREKWPTDKFATAIHALTIRCKNYEPEYPEIAKVFSVEDAVNAWWLL